MSGVLRPGVFLLADPGLTDPNFEGSVVLLCAHGAEGSLGLVLNRPLDLKLEQVLAEPGPFEGRSAEMFWGGPVGMDRLHVLHGGSGSAHSLAVCPGVCFGGELAELASLQEQGRPVRFFLGYSGWDAGQLEEELRADTWLVVPAAAPHVFDAETATLWQRLVASQDDRFSWLRHIPRDPTVN